MLFYTKTVQQTLKELDTGRHGLAVSEAKARLKLYGSNVITVKGESLWRKIIEPFANVFMAVLFIAVVISFYRQVYLDALIISAIMMVSATIYYVQRFSTERILRSLRRHNIQKTEVLRDGKSVSIDAALLVPGDHIRLHEGDKVPADARLVEVASLRVDESQLTGESQPISKQVEVLKGSKEVYEQENMLFQSRVWLSVP